MDIDKLKLALAEVLEEGFDDSFAQFCADTFASFSYPPKNKKAAMMHALFLRLFLQETVAGIAYDDEIPENLRKVYREVSELSIRETLSSEHPSGMECCRVFVRNWCHALSTH